MASRGETGTERRERLLARIRRISLGIAAGAAVSCLALGTALAHAGPGRSAAGPARPAAPPRPTMTARPGAPPSRPASRRAAGRGHRLRPPQQPPASTPAAPQVSSGGS
jgi:hypothetical protein